MKYNYCAEISLLEVIFSARGLETADLEACLPTLSLTESSGFDVGAILSVHT